ncbi:uncharacterized protein [Procambarus clarkii]|uniref:uncharacterized protein isoform X1 n=1 Tax=Procambarus clarkii TaxID=6728 RepID=UPI001E670001|nr:uncharacterized protein LOC123760006 isoform X1 [Procambarus clarkii]
MAENQQKRISGILKPTSSSSRALRRSSSDETLAGVTLVTCRLTSPVNKSSNQLTQPVTNGSRSPPTAPSSMIDVNTPPSLASPQRVKLLPGTSETSLMVPMDMETATTVAPTNETTAPTVSPTNTKAEAKTAATVASPAKRSLFPPYKERFASARSDRAGSAPVNLRPNVLSLKPESPSTARRKGCLADLKASVRSMLPPLATSHKPDETTPSGTPTTVDRGVFTISPPVKGNVSHPLLTQKAVPCEGDPFDQRRKISSASITHPEGEEGDHEPVWQRRLSQLFVPPTDNDLDPEHEAEESSQLLPKSSSALILQKRVTPDSSPSSSPGDQRREPERGRERKRREGVVRKEQGKPKTQSRIIFLDDKYQQQEEEVPAAPKAVVDDIDSDASSSIHTSDEEEEPGGDDYTSWDDTICSNRSAYFKMYYSQRGIIGGNREESKSKALQPSSHNSLSSLIQEKMGKPNTPATKTRAEIGLMVLVVLLFVTIVLGISLTTYFYNLHLLELSIFNCIKFYESPRILEIYNAEWKPLTTVHLGSSLPPNSIPEDCTNYLHYLKRHNYTMPHKRPDDDDYEDMVCLDWTGLAQLQLRKLYAQGDVQCYSVWWGAANEEFKLRDCLKADKEHGVWWGGGEMSEGGFPVTNANIAPERMVTGKLGRDSWGQLLRHTWLSDRASLLTLPESFSGQVSINYENDGQVCLETGPYPSLIAPLPTMEYHLCTAPNVTSLIYFMHQEAVNKRKIVVEASSSLVTHKSYVEENQNTEAPLGHPKAVGHMNVSRKPRKILKEIFKKEVKDRVQERLEHPVWVPWMPPDRPQLTQEAVIEYVESILSKKYGLQGHVLLPPSWQGEPGELEFDPDRFPDPALLAQTLKDKGFHLALTIHPFVSVGASAFNSGTRENLWVRQKNSSLPALTNYDESHPSVVTDFSNPRGTKWFTSRLQHLQKSYKIDRFHLQPADAHALPVFHEYHMPLPGPDSILVYFMASVSAVSPPVSTEGTVTTPMPPTFLTLGTADGSWRGLGTLVPRVLTLAMLGYSLVDVGPIGGIARHGHVPERELYIRWLQVATFLPAMQISVLPHMYDKEVVNLVTEYIEIRKTMVLPRLLQNVSDALELGTPLIHPLALFDPNDTEAAKVHDEWILGEDLLIAPVTERGKRNRNIYLPTGIWKDEIDGNLRRGGRWLKDYKVPLTKTPHFTLKSVEGNAR